MTSHFLMKLLFPAFAVILIATHLVKAETVSSPIVGFVSVNVEPDSDTVFAPTFHKPASFVGRVAAAPTIANGVATISLNVANLGLLNEYADTHYLSILSGAESGKKFKITTSRSTSLDIDLDGQSSLSLLAGHEVAVIGYWTLESLFPPDQQPAEQKASGNFPPQRELELLVYEGGDGVSISPAHVYFLTTTGWKKSTKGFPDANTDIVQPNSVVVLRTNGGGTAWDLVTVGNVDQDPSAVVLRTAVGKKQDNMVGINRPVSVQVSELGLETAFIESPSTSEGDRQDELLVVDNSSGAKNRVPTRTYFRSGGAWISDEAGFPNADADEISPDSALIVRKAPTQDGLPVLWVNLPNYP